MARPKEDKKDILILYEASDSEQWVEYIQECFKECPATLELEAKDLEPNLENVGYLSTKFTMILLVISSKMLKTLQDNVEVLLPTMNSHRTVSVLKLYLDDVNYDSEVTQYYDCATRWTCFSIGNDDGVEQAQEAISHIIDVLQNCKTQKLPSPPQKRSSYIQSICPDCIRQGGETVQIVLRRAVEEDQTVQVRIGPNDTDKMIDTERLNEYCFTFKAPEHKAGKALLYLFVDGRKKCKNVIHYSSMTRFAYTYPEFLCQLIGLSHDDRQGLDKELNGIFRTSAPQDGTLEKLLTPKMLDATSTASVEGSESVGELPTLLHFACKYSLNELAVSIIDSPGAHRAIHMDNDRGIKPIHLAEENNNEELVNYIEAFMEMHDYVTDVEELYEKMSGGKILVYDNTARGAGLPGYLHMGNRDSVEEAYAKGRLVTDRESDYEITGGVRGLVDEVLPEDDVAPEVPVRPPRPANISGTYQSRKTIQIHTSVQPEPSHPDDDWKDSGCIPPDDKIFSGDHPLSPGSMGSTNLDELQQYAEAYKRGEFGLDDIERLYQAWHTRNRNLQSVSLKERQKQIDEFKKEHATKIKGKKKSILPWKKKQELPNMAIEHNVEANKYESWTIMRGAKLSNSNRSSCDSCISNISTTSTTSSSSRDSALERVIESDSDQDSPQDFAPPVPRRPKPATAVDNRANRASWGDQYLNNVKKKAKSRLPTPPTQKYTPVSRKRSTSPIVPPRPPRS